MRALQLTQGAGAPQEWVQLCMLICAYAVMVQAVLILLQPVFLLTNSTYVAVMLETVEKLAMLGLYGATIGVVVGIQQMTPEDCGADPSIWDAEGGPPAVSPAVGATILLASQFFAIYCGAKILETLEKFVEKPEDANLPLALIRDPVMKSRVLFYNTMITWKATVETAKATVGMAPQLAILFIACRMRALQLDPKTGNPPVEAQYAFYACSFAILGQCILIL